LPTIHLHARTLLLIARENAMRARADAAPPNALPTDAILAIVMSAASTEAFINEFAEYVAPSFPTVASEMPPGAVTCAEVLKELEESRVPPTVKYLVGSQVLGRAFNAGAAPFQDFKMLIELRNAIMHVKVALEGGRHPGERVTDALAQRGLAIAARGPSSLPWFDRLMTPEVAIWAHDSALAIVSEFLELVPVPGSGYADPLWLYRHSYREHPSIPAS
jgi:hypothetical protein